MMGVVQMWLTGSHGMGALTQSPWLEDTRGGHRQIFVSVSVDCLQSAFSLKIRLVLISSSVIPNHDVIITYALVSRGSRLRRWRA